MRVGFFFLSSSVVVWHLCLGACGGLFSSFGRAGV